MAFGRCYNLASTEFFYRCFMFRDLIISFSELFLGIGETGLVCSLLLIIIFVLILK